MLNWNHLAPVERAERLRGAWDGEWFEEDYCEGPGQALIVDAEGRGEAVLRLRLGPGPADDRQHPHATRSRRSSRAARKHPYVGKVFREGLTAIRDEILARDPDALPGATSNHCFFCWYVLTKGVFDRARTTSGAGRQRRQPVGEAVAADGGRGARGEALQGRLSGVSRVAEATDVRASVSSLPSSCSVRSLAPFLFLTKKYRFLQ